MPIYNEPVWSLMHEMVEEKQLPKGEIITRDEVVAWFSSKYPKIKTGTIQAHLIRMSTNAPSRIHYHGKPGTDDLFFQLDSGRFRLYEAETDPAPICGATRSPLPTPPLAGGEDEAVQASEFAYEADLRDYLARNLGLLEAGLRLYEEEGITGLEFPAGGRSIDILAVASNNDLVVIELKVSRGYDRTLGQILRYIGWIEENLAESGQKVRGIIVAREISEDLLLACRRLPDISLFEYELSVTVRRIQRPSGTESGS